MSFLCHSDRPVAGSLSPFALLNAEDPLKCGRAVSSLPFRVSPGIVRVLDVVGPASDPDLERVGVVVVVGMLLLYRRREKKDKGGLLRPFTARFEAQGRS